MFLLITNDDGIHAPGLDALVKAALSGGHEVLVCAPHVQQSAVSQHITLNRPLFTHKLSIWENTTVWSVEGTPADCVRIGLEIAGRKPDCCLSGINDGENAGSALYYSGTYGAAREAAMHHIPAFALSVMRPADESMYEALARYAVDLMQRADLTAFPKTGVVNVNAPAKPPETWKPPVLCPVSDAYYLARYEKRVSPGGMQYYWLQMGLPMEEPKPGSDYDCLYRGHVTVSVLTSLREANDGAERFITL